MGDDRDRPVLYVPQIRPRALVRGLIVTATPLARATVYLLNDSNAGRLIVVRDLYVSAVGNANAPTKIMLGKNGARGGSVAPVYGGVPTLAGSLWFNDEAAYTDGNYECQVNWPAQIPSPGLPLAILPVGYSFVIQQGSPAVNMDVSLLWEVIDPHDLEYFEE